MERRRPGGEGTLALVPLEKFLSRLPESLAVLSTGRSGTALAPMVRWVEPSELPDPTPYLLEGEFVLTAGLPFLEEGGTGQAVDDYVRRLVAAEVCALGFGISPYFSAVPDELIRACRRHALTLVRVPEEIPFAALGLEFARLLEAENLAVLRMLSEANRALMRAVLTKNPESELLEVLTRTVPVWAVLVGTDRRLRSRAAPENLQASQPSREELEPLLERLFAGSGPRIEVESFTAPGARAVVGYPLRSTRDANLGALIVGAGAPLGPVEKDTVETAVGLLEVLVRQRTGGALAPGQLATALLLHPQTTRAGDQRSQAAASKLLGQSASANRNTKLRVVQGIHAQDPEVSAGRVIEEEPVRELLEWRRIFDTKLVEMTPYGFAAVTRLRVDDSVTAEVENLGCWAVISDPVELPGLPEAYRQATSLQQRARTERRSVRADAVGVSVTSLLGPAAGARLAQRSFEPLYQLEPKRATALLNVLRAWLRENGSWDGSAKALGLHRNSVRRQIGLLSEVLGRDLANAETRAELLIALNYVGPELLPQP